MTNQIDSLVSESEKRSSKISGLKDKLKNKIGTVFASSWMMTSPMGGTAPAVLPTSVNTIRIVAPVAKVTAEAIALGTATQLLTACGSDNDVNDPSESIDNIAPNINVIQSSVDISGGKQVRISGNQLYIGDILVASRSDNKTKNCRVSLSINGKSITSGTTLSEEGMLTLKVSDDTGNVKSTNIKLNVTVEYDITGLENLKNLDMQVDQEVNLLDGVTIGNGASLEKVEIEVDGQRLEVSDPYHYTPEYPGGCSIILTVKDKNGKSTEYKVDNLTIKALDYKAMEVSNIRPVDILPIIGQIESGDKNAYQHIEHLRIAEATRIRDMMWKYGAGNHSPEEYQQLMMRLKTGMTMENPKGYDNYEIIGGNVSESGQTNHAHDERNILNNLINHANFYVVNPTEGSRRDKLYEFVKNNPNSICIFGNSSSAEVDKGTYESRGNDVIKNLCKSKNFLIFVAGGNIGTKNGILRNKIYHEDVNGDEHGLYSLPSSANGKNDASADRHLIVSIGTDADGDVDQTNETYESSKFPVGFHNNILFAGRTFPRFKISSGKVVAETGKYPTSYVNYTNVAIADLIFQMKADVANVDELLTMIRSSTDLKDHIRFNGEDQPLILMNPAGFFKKYLMPNNLPSSIQSSKTVNLNKGYYKGVIFDIPGTEVKINGEWIAFNDTNKSLIKSQNPMSLEWRMNGDLCRKLGYKGKYIQGKIIAVDDKRNGLNIDKEFSISMQ